MSYTAAKRRASIVCYVDGVARMLGNTAKHYIIACAYSQAPHNSRERQEDSRLRLSSASVCRLACVGVRPSGTWFRVVFG